MHVCLSVNRSIFVVDLGEPTSNRVTCLVLLRLIILSTVLRVLRSPFYSFLLKHLRAGKGWDLWGIIELKCLKGSLCKNCLRRGSIVLDHGIVSLESRKS